MDWLLASVTVNVVLIVGAGLVSTKFWRMDKKDRERVVLAEEERAKDSALLGSLGEGIVVLDKNGTIVKANPMAESLTGWKAAEMRGKNWDELVPLEDENGKRVPIADRASQKVLETKKVFANDKYYYVRKDGKKFPVGTTAAPVLVKGKVIGVIKVFRDITREKYIDKAKSEFVSLASHQLRTPLSSIKWFSEMLLHGDAGELAKEQKEFVNNIFLSNERMIDLVNSLLNISRIESGRIIVDPVPTDVGQLVRELIKELEVKIKEKNMQMAVSVYENMPKINLDPKLIRQVYMNLLTNSIKYTPAGGRIVVMISIKDKEILSQISDNGYGIPKREQERVFQKFYRGENVVKVEIDGTGLGLYLVKAIVESSGGKIWFESEEGKGTAFWFTLPLEGTPAKKGEVTLT